MSNMRYLYIGIMGLGGVFARYSVNSLFIAQTNWGFPAATVSINIVGSFLIGLVYIASAQTALLSEDLRVALMAGLLGGFTTFSAFSLDTVTMISENRILLACIYVAGSVGGGLLATVFGMYVAKLIFG